MRTGETDRLGTRFAWNAFQIKFGSWQWFKTFCLFTSVHHLPRRPSKPSSNRSPHLQIQQREEKTSTLQSARVTRLCVTFIGFSRDDVTAPAAV